MHSFESFLTQMLVDDTGIEPVTPSMSRKCATAALIVRKVGDVTPKPCLERSSASEIVLHALDIVFAEVGSGLHLDEDEF